MDKLKLSDGALLIDKPATLTSFDVIRRIQSTLAKKYEVKRSALPKIGHGGTLDPFATGLLVVCVGRAVKLTRYFLDSNKVYWGKLQFGYSTASADPTTDITQRTDAPLPKFEAIKQAAKSFENENYTQMPPMHSAKKVNGQTLYKLARKGIEVERKPKNCRIDQFECLNYDEDQGTLEFRVHCSSGTYIRTLAEDLAKKLNQLAVLQELRREASARKTIDRALTLDEVLEEIRSGKNWDEFTNWVDFNALLDEHVHVEASQDEKQALVHGKQEVLLPILKKIPDFQFDSDRGVAIYCEGKLVATACRTGDSLHWGVERVFPELPPIIMKSE